MTMVSHEEVGNVRNRNQGWIFELPRRDLWKWRPVDFSPLCRGGLSTIFRRFTSLLGVATRLTRIDKTSSRSLVFSILAGRDCHSRVADKRCGTGAKPGRDGHFFFTNKQTRRYIHSCQGTSAVPFFLSQAPEQGGTNHSHWIWLWWRKRKNCWKYCSRLLRYALAMMRSLWMWL